MNLSLFRLLLCAVFSAAGMARLYAESAAAPEPRTALVIGVSKYDDTYFGPLQSPTGDAEKMARQLRALGFEVQMVKDAKLRQIIDAMDAFGATLAKRGGVGLFYFSGHGVQHEAQNYLVPVGTAIRTAGDLPEEAVATQRVINRMSEAKNRLNLVFLDACRSDNLPIQTKGGASGLAAMRGGSGLMVFFATQPGQVAFDNADGTGSIFTTALLNHLGTPGTSFMDMMSDVTQETETLSTKISEGKERQTPFVSGSLSGRFYFAPGNLAVTPMAPVQTPPPIPAPSPVAEQTPPSQPSASHSGWVYGLGDAVVQDGLRGGLLLSHDTAPTTPPNLRPSGYFDLQAIFTSGPYANYNAHSRQQILKRVQQKLKDAGLYSGNVDGGAGPKTQAALDAWQQKNGGNVSGHLDQATLETMKLTGIGQMTALGPGERSASKLPRDRPKPSPASNPPSTAQDILFGN